MYDLTNKHKRELVDVYFRLCTTYVVNYIPTSKPIIT